METNKTGLSEAIEKGEALKGKNAPTFADLIAAQIEEAPALFGKVFLLSDIALLTGGSDTGKSTLLRQMCMYVAQGAPFLGMEFRGQHKAAIYMSSEDSRNLTAAALKRYNKTIGLGGQAANIRAFFEWDSTDALEILSAALNDAPADLVVIDALGDAFNGRNLNDNTEVRKFFASYKRLAKQYGCLILFLHHTGKRTDAYAPDKNNTIGSQALEAAPRLVMELRADPADSDTKHLCIVKANHLPNSAKRLSIAMRMDENLVFHTTGNNKPFEELAKTPATATGRRPTKPEDFPETQHRNFLKREMTEPRNQSFLRKAIGIEFQVSDRLQREFIDYYKNNGYIKKSATPGARGSVMYEPLSTLVK